MEGIGQLHVDVSRGSLTSLLFKQHYYLLTVFILLGLYYITEGDIKRYSNLRMDKMTHSVLTILRHCNRIREQRGGGVVRYVLLSKSSS